MFLSVAVVVSLGQALKTYHVEPFSWVGLGMIIPPLVITALLLSLLLHSDNA